MNQFLLSILKTIAMKKKLLFTFIYLSFCGTLLASFVPDDFYFTKLDADNGLSHNNVKAIIQDSYGFMWFGTRNGLNRYDGCSLKLFNCYDSRLHKGNQNISALYEDQNKLLWVGTDKGVYKFNPITAQFSFIELRATDGVQMDDWVQNIMSDHRGNVWIVVPIQGVFRYEIKTQRLYHYLRGSKHKSSVAASLCITSDGQVWVGSNGAGLFKFDAQTNRFIQHLVDYRGNSLLGEDIYAMCDYGNYLALGIHEGKLRKWNKKTSELSDVEAPEIFYKIIRDVQCYDGKTLWVATQSGLYVVNEVLHHISNAQENDMIPYSISDNNICKIYKDRENGIWAGTMLGGVDYMPELGMVLHRYVPLNKPGSLSSKKICGLIEDKNGMIWIGTEDGGVNVFDPRHKLFLQPRPQGAGKGNNLALMNDGDHVWVGMFKNGVDIFSVPVKGVQHYTAKEMHVNDESVFALCKDSRGHYWLGTATGVYFSDKGPRDFAFIKSLGSLFTYDIQEDKYGNIWIATMGNGVYKYALTTGKVKVYKHQDNNLNSLSSNTVSSITVTNKGVVWFSTDRGGICKYNERTDNFTCYTKKNGLPDDVAYKILEDKQHNLWFGTNRGLVRFNPKTLVARVFTKSDGLLSNQFNYKAAVISRSGELYFGGDGLVSFSLHNIRRNAQAPAVYITKLSIYNKELNIGDKDSLLKHSIEHTDKVVLNYTQSNISFDFVGLSYVAAQSNRFAYKMDGVDKEWIYPAKGQTASYNLSPGEYVFHVKASNNDGVWNEKGASITVIITPPWWSSILAYIIYFILLVLGIYCWFRWYKQKKQREYEDAQKLYEINKEKELYVSKVNFFTSIAHEIKTPLSLINGPLENLLDIKIDNPKLNYNLHVMEQNTNRLLNLINQLLDFRKVDSKQWNLNFMNIDIIALLKETVERFEPSILTKGKIIELLIADKQLIAPVDKEALTKILSNLLNNALKYAQHTIIVKLSKNETYFSISVESDGEIISEEQKTKVFEPFYQIHRAGNKPSGVGLGLSMAYFLAQLHSGDLTLTSDDHFNIFNVTLPLQQENVISLPEEVDTINNIIKEQEIEVPSRSLLVDNRKYTILIVEDNQDLLQFMTECLMEYFIIKTAPNGSEGLKVLEKENINLIVSDIMMPVMNGLDFVREVRNNWEYSFIPIILLTANTNLGNRIEGVKRGADVYLEKPFSFHFLISQINTLLTNKEKEIEALNKRPYFVQTSPKASSADKELMKKISEEIEKNISDENFNVEQLAENLTVSRSYLYRKIKELYDTSPVDLIRISRLKKALKIIHDGEYRISEVGMMVGITTPSYFTRLFQKQFGVSPKEYAMQCQREADAQKEK